MRNKYLLLGAASALMLAACSEDINNGPDVNKPVENALNLTSLDAASQAGRVTLPGQTRGQKSDRLQLVAKIAPVADAAANNWSATGIAISNGNAYVSWHSNRQATNQATAWGGAIDVLSINALAGLSGAVDPAGVITGTQVSSTAKFNGIVADGSTFYLPITSYNYGAAVGRWTPGAEAVDTIVVPGVSANSIAVRGNDLYVVTGYKGGLYSFPAANFDAETRADITERIEYSETFGGKYIDGDRVLRTDDNAMEIVDLSGNRVYTGAPLKSNEKQAETYDPETGEWTLVEGTNATHYGKHTMAVDGNYTYVAGGVTEGTENGLRVYFGTNSWSNGTSTNAVTVATVGDKKLVFAATGAGLRVYEPYNTEERKMPLFAFEVLNYDENGMAADAPDSNKPVAGTDAHSANFVAVDSSTGLVFVACGQSGVYVFRLNTTVEVEKKLTGFITELGDGVGNDMVDEDSDDVSFTVPAGPVIDDKTFEKWVDNGGNEYQPGDSKNFKPGDTTELTPVYSAVVTFKYDDTTSDVKVTVGETVRGTQFPNPTVPADHEFNGWVIEGTSTPFDSQTVVEKNITVVPNITEHIYAYILHFDGNKEGVEVSNLPGDIKQDNEKMTIPNVTPSVPEGTLNPAFIGWATDPAMTSAHKDAGFWTPIMPGDPYTCTSANTTLYAIWATNVTAGGNQGGNVEEEKPSGNGGAGDSGSGSM